MRLAIALITGMSIVVAAAGAYYVLGDTQTLSVLVLAMDDPDDTGRITQLDLLVSNPGPRDAQPVFTVPGNALGNWYPWTIESGPDVLHAGDAATYRISMLPYTAPQIPEGFRVIVRDQVSDWIHGGSDVTPVTLDRLRPAVYNPRFAAWEESMIAPYPVPYGWQPFHSLQPGDAWEVRGENGTLVLGLTPGAGGDAKLASFMSMRERINFPKELTIAFGGTPSESAIGLGGILLQTSDANHSIFIFHSANGRLPNDVEAWADNAGTELGLASRARGLGTADTVMLFTNGTITIDVEQVFLDAGWTLPAERYLPKTLPVGPQDVGFGAWAAILEKYEVIRPLEIKAFVFAVPGSDTTPIVLTLHEVGGAALDAAAPWTVPDA